MSQPAIQKILIVDDKAGNTASLARVLEREGLQILQAHAGNDALGLMLEHEFALVLLDVQMPGMDGYEVASLMRRNERTLKVPIIFLTAINKEYQHVRNGYQAGAVDYLFKPVDPEIIRAKVKIFLELDRSRREKDLLVAELNTSNARLQELYRRKSDFLAAASHELRTPLTVIREFCSLVHDEVVGTLNQEQKNCLQSALRNCDRLAAMVNDLLDLESVESGSHPIRRDKVDAGALATTLFKDFAPRCTTAGLDFRLEVGENLPPVLADMDLITQVLVNLLGNALKFTPPEGRITLAVAACPQGVRVEVRDTGCGIAPEDQGRVFEKFTQLKRREGPGCQGTGLGLPISRRIAQLHGGDIKLASSPGNGSRFWLDLPAYETELHLRTLLQDARSSAAGYPGPWTLVLLRMPVGYAGWRQDVSEVLRGVMRRGEDRKALLEIADTEVVGVLLKSGRDGAIAFLSRLEKGLATAGIQALVSVQFALEEFSPGDDEEAAAQRRHPQFISLALGLDNEGVDDVQKKNPGR